jgi:hypothetical protein
MVSIILKLFQVDTISLQEINQLSVSGYMWLVVSNMVAVLGLLGLVHLVRVNWSSIY